MCWRQVTAAVSSLPPSSLASPRQSEIRAHLDTGLAPPSHYIPLVPLIHSGLDQFWRLIIYSRDLPLPCPSVLRVVSLAWMTRDMLCGSAGSDGALLVFMLYAVDIVCCAVSDIVCCRYALRVCCMLLVAGPRHTHTSTSTRIKSEAVVKCKMSNQEEISGRFAECRVLSAALQC